MTSEKKSIKILEYIDCECNLDGIDWEVAIEVITKIIEEE